MSAIAAGAERTKTRLDQWLWFARFVKSRSLAARLCAAGAVAVNGLPIKKANHLVRIGDIVVLPQGGWRRTVRVSALGKKGAISELLKTLGTMSPEERKQNGPRINGLKDEVSAAIAARREVLKALALDARLNTETVDVTLPVREPPAEAGATFAVDGGRTAI